MSVSEFASWVAYDNIRPIGGDRVDLLLAEIVTTLRATAGVRNCSIFDSAYWLDDRTKEQAHVRNCSIFDSAYWLDDRTKEQAHKEKMEELRAGFLNFVNAHNERIDKNGNDSGS